MADVIVVGGGNAALCAAIAASDAGADVTVLERAPEAESGGNSRFTAGSIRFAYSDLEELREVLTDLSLEELATSDFGSYPKEQFFDDMFRVTEYRCDPDLVECLVTRSKDTLVWLRRAGIRFVPIYGRQAFRVDGKFRFWGGLTVEASGGGPGLVDGLTVACRKRGIEIAYGTRAIDLDFDGRDVTGVIVRRRGGRPETLPARAVILASGGFQANPEWRTRYLGPGWELARVRGTRFNTGDGIRMALAVGAAPYGNWSGCHSVAWDRNAPEFGDLAVGDQFQKHSYPFGIVVNSHGRRFLDEGADFRNYTYAKYGAELLRQPGQYAWQIFDAKAKPLLRDEYSIRQVTRVRADTLDELLEGMQDVDREACKAEIESYNAAVRQDIAFDPNVRDGRRTEGLAVNKSNWANTIDEPPLEAYAVTCGITFTFGGLRIDADARVLDTELEPIPGLYAAGELVGGLFFHNYPGGTGLLAGAVFGRICGISAARSPTAE